MNRCKEEARRAVRRYLRRLDKAMGSDMPDFLAADEFVLLHEAMILYAGYDVYKGMGERAIENARRHFGWCQSCDTPLNPGVTHDPICERCDARQEAEAEAIDEMLDEGGEG